MIARLWRGRAEGANAAAYHRHFTETVTPELKALAGHQGAWLLRREVEGQTEFLAVTLWESLDAIRAFAGDAVETAIVEPQARAVLSSFDGFAHHYEVVGKG
ncbi:MAG: antibiotic biosynthesis monooxygenase [Reyranella sp.]|nr:antibiotic biosynthesis monooxygenase [Reyranella sp.]